MFGLYKVSTMVAVLAVSVVFGSNTVNAYIEGHPNMSQDKINFLKQTLRSNNTELREVAASLLHQKEQESEETLHENNDNTNSGEYNQIADIDRLRRVGEHPHENPIEHQEEQEALNSLESDPQQRKENNKKEDSQTKEQNRGLFDEEDIHAPKYDQNHNNANTLRDVGSKEDPEEDEEHILDPRKQVVDAESTIYLENKVDSKKEKDQESQDIQKDNTKEEIGSKNVSDNSNDNVKSNENDQTSEYVKEKENKDKDGEEKEGTEIKSPDYQTNNLKKGGDVKDLDDVKAHDVEEDDGAEVKSPEHQTHIPVKGDDVKDVDDVKSHDGEEDDGAEVKSPEHQTNIPVKGDGVKEVDDVKSHDVEEDDGAEIKRPEYQTNIPVKGDEVKDVDDVKSHDGEEKDGKEIKSPDYKTNIHKEGDDVKDVDNVKPHDVISQNKPLNFENETANNTKKETFHKVEDLNRHEDADYQDTTKPQVSMKPRLVTASTKSIISATYKTTESSTTSKHTSGLTLLVILTKSQSHKKQNNINNVQEKTPVAEDYFSTKQAPGDTKRNTKYISGTTDESDTRTTAFKPIQSKSSVSANFNENQSTSSTMTEVGTTQSNSITVVGKINTDSTSTTSPLQETKSTPMFHETGGASVIDATLKKEAEEPIRTVEDDKDVQLKESKIPEHVTIPCNIARHGRYYDSSSLVAAAVGGAFVGAVLILALFYCRTRFNRYIRGDYKRLPMEYDFELNPRLKTP